MEIKQKINCPFCKEKLNYLRYETNRDIYGDFSIVKGDEEWEEDGCNLQENTTKYFCPECDKLLFSDDEKAIDFLKGEKVEFDDDEKNLNDHKDLIIEALEDYKSWFDDGDKQDDEKVKRIKKAIEYFKNVEIN